MTLSKKRIGVFAILSGWGLMVLLFQNMTLVEFSTLNLPSVDEQARQDQARELLGVSYKGSLAQRFEGEQDLNYLVYKKIESSMDEKWKSRLAEITEAVIMESRNQELDPIFVLAVIQTESGFNTDARGDAGEIGLMQILPKTAEWIAKKYKMPWKGANSLFDPVTNIKIGITYFAHLRNEFDSRAYHYLPAYNMGPKNMRKVSRTIGSISPDGKIIKRDYAMRVMKNYTSIYEQMISAQKEMVQFAKDNEVEQITR
ncbi:MAG: lytic transglycosylase domain-containing protein [Bdellovibrionales bacterium]|nr:lytic transglycosylase domain-containing protein [Bdellovibrionales bacterium]